MWLDFLAPHLINKQTVLPHPHCSCRNRIFVLTEEPFSFSWWTAWRYAADGCAAVSRIHRLFCLCGCVPSTHSNYSTSVRSSYAAPKLMSSDVFLNADGMITNCFVSDSSVISGWQLQRCLSGKLWEKKKKCCFWWWNTMGGGRSRTREAGRLKVM